MSIQYPNICEKHKSFFSFTVYGYLQGLVF